MRAKTERGEKPSQTKILRDYLESGKHLTALKSYELTGTLHNPRRILDIKEQLNQEKSEFTIDDMWTKVKDRNGNKIRVKMYFLAYRN